MQLANIINNPAFLNDLDQEQRNIITKAKEIMASWAKKQIDKPCIFGDDEIRANLLQAIDEIDNQTAVLYTEDEITTNVKNRLNIV